MHSGSRFDRPSTPARPFTGAPDKLAERRWGEKRINQREKRTSPVSAAFASLANLRLIYLDNISPRRSIV